MRLRDFAIIGIGVLVIFEVVTALASIRLLSRMSPAIEDILSENVASNAAVEEMLGSLTESDTVEKRTRRFREAADRARANVTVPGETTLLNSVEAKTSAAFAGDPVAAREIVDALREIARLNRQAMQKKDVQARRIGNAGAWAMALLGIVGFSAGIFVLRRTVRTVIAPVEEIRRSLEAQLRGDSLRRPALKRSVSDFRNLEVLINKVIDLRSTDDIREKRDQERAALLHFIDRTPGPVALLSSRGELLAANRAAETLLSTADTDVPGSSVAERIAQSDSWTKTPLAGGGVLYMSTEQS